MTLLVACLLYWIIFCDGQPYFQMKRAQCGARIVHHRSRRAQHKSRRARHRSRSVHHRWRRAHHRWRRAHYRWRRAHLDQEERTTDQEERTIDQEERTIDREERTGQFILVCVRYYTSPLFYYMFTLAPWSKETNQPPLSICAEIAWNS